jgi:hypothetical protein
LTKLSCIKIAGAGYRVIWSIGGDEGEKFKGQLAEMEKNLKDHKKSDRGSMISFKNPFQKYDSRRQPFEQDIQEKFNSRKIMLKLKFFYDSRSFMDENQPSKFNEDEDDDVE